jgi:hypothetical protein
MFGHGMSLVCYLLSGQRSQESERAKQGDPTVALVRSRN